MVLILDGNSKTDAQLVQSLLLDMLEAFDQIGAVTNQIVSSPKRPDFLHARATCSELPSCI